MKKGILKLFCLLAAMFLSAPCWAMEEIKIPMSVKSLSGTKTIYLSGTLYIPDGQGPFPLAVINHGIPFDEMKRKDTQRFKNQSKEFVERGFVVVVPMRRGYGTSEGDHAEGYGHCENPDYYSAGMESARDIKAAIDFMVQRPYVDKSRILLVGQSAGGFAALAAVSLNPEGVVGVINFAGGRGAKKGGGVCSPDTLIWTVGELGRRSRIPTLWIYSENDKTVGPSLSREMREQYVKNGGNAKFVLLPPFMKDGHYLFRAEWIPVWTPIVDEFLQDLKLLERKAEQPGRSGAGETVSLTAAAGLGILARVE